MPDPKVPPLAFALPEVAAMKIFKEGQGNDGAWWTCGPSATRNVVRALFKRTTGRYKDTRERVLAKWEGTAQVGTGRGNVARALNKHFAFRPWSTWQPASAKELLAAVMLSTYVNGRAVIANLDTRKLQFWHGVSKQHFNFIYGYDKTAHTLMFGEEYDPKFRYGTYANSDPYGHQETSIASAFYGVTHPSLHGIVA